MRIEDKDRVGVEVTQRVLSHWTRDADAVEHALFDTIYEERRRLEREKKRSRKKREGAFYGRIYHEALKTSPERQKEMLKEIIQFFVEEVTGHFDPRVYELATRVIPPALSVLLNTVSPLRLLETVQGSDPLVDQLEIGGEIEALKNAAELGTTVLVPTHSSNLDSILIGFALYRMGLPPYTYGAGLNLFSNKLMSFFIR